MNTFNSRDGEAAEREAFAASRGSASKERVKARMEGAAAALEKRKLDANNYPEESDLHFEWLAGWAAART